jgi:hypothetical protein
MGGSCTQLSVVVSHMETGCSRTSEVEEERDHATMEEFDIDIHFYLTQGFFTQKSDRTRNMNVMEPLQWINFTKDQ